MKTSRVASPPIAFVDDNQPSSAAHLQSLRRSFQDADAGLRALDGCLGALLGSDQQHDPALATLQIRDLVLSALGLREQPPARDRGINAARLGAVLVAIRGRAGERGLNPADVARQAGISVRYLHRLLEPTGRTFSQHLLEQRLERARAELRNPERRLRIAAIAFASGFSDISHFNRSFRRAFGDTPYGMRVRAARRRQS
jgi:AraC-like DNA-binding protein